MKKKGKLLIITTIGILILMILSLILAFLYEMGTFEFYFWYFMYLIILFLLGNIGIIIVGKVLLTNLKKIELSKNYVFFKKIRRIRIGYIGYILAYTGFIILAGGLISKEIITIFSGKELFPEDLFILILFVGLTVFLLSITLVGIFFIEKIEK